MSGPHTLTTTNFILVSGEIEKENANKNKIRYYDEKIMHHRM